MNKYSLLFIAFPVLCMDNKYEYSQPAPRPPKSRVQKIYEEQKITRSTTPPVTKKYLEVPSQPTAEDAKKAVKILTELAQKKVEDNK